MSKVRLVHMHTHMFVHAHVTSCLVCVSYIPAVLGNFAMAALGDASVTLARAPDPYLLGYLLTRPQT